MKRTLTSFVLIIPTVMGLAYGQAGPGPMVKKPRVLEDYKAGTLKEIVAADDPRDPLVQKTGLAEHADLFPFRVRAIYKASTRPTSANSKTVLQEWALCCAGNPDHYTKFYPTEMQFEENGTAYWLAIHNSLLADLQKELKVGQALDLFLIRIRTRKGSVLLLEKFQRVEPGNDALMESQEWISTHLSEYAGRDLKVEVPARCQLRIMDSSRDTGVSKAVVLLPLNHLDPSKVSVERQKDSDTWSLWLHTNAGKDSIRFMLYQGSPAEGGATDKYSLSFSDREKAEAMAEGFRRVIKLCAGAKTTIG